MSIKDRNLKPGTKLVAHYRKQTYTAEVVEADGGTLCYNLPDGRKLLLKGENKVLHYRLQDGREFKSLSAAAVAITGKSVNGWAFWSVEQAAATGEEPKQPEPGGSSAPSTAEPGPAIDYFMRIASQKGVSEGQTRWYCPECGESFIVPSGGAPASCPQGHKA